MRILALTDVPDSCYRRGGFPSTTPRRSVYGDQGQEVAWEVGQERCAKREQEESRDHEVTRQVRRRSQRLFGAFVGVGESWALRGQIQTKREREWSIFS